MSKEIIQRNKLISEFMGAKWSETNQGWLYWFDNPPTTHATHQWNDFALQYHSSWDWLMPVVEKIFYKGAWDITIGVGSCSIYGEHEQPPYICNGEESTINSVWRSVVQFIQWYNTQSKNNSGGEKSK